MARRGDLTIRRLRPGDSDELVALLSEAFAEEFEAAGTEPEALRRQMRAAGWTQAPLIRRLLSVLGARFAFLVAEYRGRIVGSTAVGGGRLLVVSSVAVLPSFRGLGIGRALVEEAQRFALDHGRDRVALDVLSHNETALHLYERMGYVEYHRLRAYELAVLPASIVAATPRGYWLEPLGGSRAAAFSAIERASLPPRYFEVAPTLRDRYVRPRGTRWLETVGAGTRAYRRAIVHDGRTAGYLLAMALPGQTQGRVEMPLLPPISTDALPVVLADAAKFVEGAGRSSLRLDLSEDRPDQHAAAETVGFRHRWTYIQMVHWLSAPIRIPVRVGDGRGVERIPQAPSSRDRRLRPDSESLAPDA